MPVFTGVVGVSVGMRSACAWSRTGEAWCWGDNTTGQLATRDNLRELLPAKLARGNWSKVAVGGGQACALQKDPDDTAWCWGNNGYGQLGNSSNASVTDPLAVSNSMQYDTLDLGDQHSCAITSGGHAFCWGRNDSEQLVSSSTRPQETIPVSVQAGQVTSIAGGFHFTCFVDQTTKAIRCGGTSSIGQLGNTTVTDQTAANSVPLNPAPAGILFTSVAAGREHGCALSSTDHLVLGPRLRGPARMEARSAVAPRRP